jgi:asparagine synthase (glutamine-hydrolysing)
LLTFSAKLRATLPVCGISGIFHYGDTRPVDGAALRLMAHSLAHRGPDDAGYLEDGLCGFGFRRLSVIDLLTGNQPIRSADGARAIILNGEIYNYIELRSELRDKGRHFLTKSDTEVVLAAYEHDGVECPTSLCGMFAFAVWDRDRQRLLLARDRLGVKPLYYLDDGRRLIFGSEIKAILAAGGVSRDVDPESVADYFALRYVPGPKTIFKAIRKLPPGCWMSVEAGRTPVIRRYWDVRFEVDDDTSEDTWIERLRELVDEAVRSRLAADVPLGAFLSGGVDSSTVVATMARLSQRPVSTHTVGFDEQAFDETAAARRVADRYATDHHESILHPEAVSAAETLVWHFDEPFGDSSAIPAYYLAKAARNHVTVALSGDGGDESFAGYAKRYAFVRRHDDVRTGVPASLRPLVFGLPARLYPPDNWLPRVLRAKIAFTNLAADPHQAFFNAMSLGTCALSPLLSGDLRRMLRDYRPSGLFKDLMEASGTSDPVSRAQYVDLKTFLPDDVMTKVDRTSMAVGLEAREPLLDHRLVEAAARIPSRMKLSNGEGKRILKKAVADRVSGDILARPKQGFEAPVGRWLRGPLRDLAHATLFDPVVPGAELLDRASLVVVWERHQSGRTDSTHHLWPALMFRLWAKRFGAGV